MNERQPVRVGCPETVERGIRSFVRRAKPLRAQDRQELDRRSQLFALPFQKKSLDFRELFPQREEIFLEVGFGMGEALESLSCDHPQCGYLGVDVHLPGVARLLKVIEKKSLANLRLINHDAMEVLKWMIPEGSLSGVHIFFPDPWPKRRHHKRRLLSQGLFLDALAHALKREGYLHFVSDWLHYAKEVHCKLEEHSSFENLYPPLWAPPQTNRPCTRFEKRGVREGREVYELLYRRNVGEDLSFAFD